MAWPKLKNIVILMLLLTNLCLLAFAVNREVRDRALQQQAMTDAISFLQDRGVRLEAERVPKADVLLPQRVERNLEDERALAAALLGADLTREPQGGDVYRYESPAGTLQCHSSGEFWAAFSPNAFPVSGQTMAEHALAAMAVLNFQGEIIAQSGSADHGSITLRQRWNGVPLLSCQAVLTYQGGCLTDILSGRRLVGTPVAAAGTPITAVTALMNFYTGINDLGDVCSQIRSITQAYVLASTLGGPIPMTPVWHITTDTGAYQLDLLTGQLSRAESYVGLPSAVRNADSTAGG